MFDNCDIEFVGVKVTAFHLLTSTQATNFLTDLFENRADCVLDIKVLDNR